jgi:hypothetical protein
MRGSQSKTNFSIKKKDEIEGDSNQNRTSRSLRRKTSAQSIDSEGKDVYYSAGVRK